MTLLARSNVVSRFLQILLCVALFASPLVWSHQAVGISIDDLDQFVIAISGVEILCRGYFEVRQPLSVDVTLTESPRLHSEHSYFWSALTAEEKTDNSLLPFHACALTSPSALSTSQKYLVSSTLAEIFGCADDTFVVRETHAITSALKIEPVDVENSSIAIIAPNAFTYILGEDFSTTVVVETFSPPLNLDIVVSKHDIKEIIVVLGSQSPRFGQAYGTTNIPIRYEPNDIIARGAAVIATSTLPEEPVSVLPLALGIVLHGCLSHIVIPSFSVLPKRARVALTTVHDNQHTTVIEVREGIRARAEHNLFVTKLHLSGIPPAPAGATVIEVTLTAERNNNRILVEAAETLSGKKAIITVERDGLIYPEELLEDHQAAGEKYREEDTQFRSTITKRASNEKQPDDAVQLFVKQFNKHEEL